MAQRTSAYFKKSKEHEYDWQRTGRMMVWGSVFFAPLGHAWYNFLDRFVRTVGKKAIAQKVVLDMLIFAPPSSFGFFTFNNVLSGQSFDEATNDAWKKLPTTLLANYAVWPGIQVITFGYIPLQYRVLFINVMYVGWSMFLSMMAADPDALKAAIL